MGREVKHYVGKEITPEVISKINLIAMTRYEEGTFSVLYEGVDTLEQLCSWHGALPEQENIVLGEDWVIIYVKRKNDIELAEWLDIEDVPNKFCQTMEMFKAMTDILLEGEGLYLLADMRHDTSYQFYQSMLKKCYFETYREYVDVEEGAPGDVLDFADRILDEYHSYEEYFSCDEREKKEEYEKYFYHSLSFGVTKKFVKRYGKKLLEK